MVAKEWIGQREGPGKTSSERVFRNTTMRAREAGDRSIGRREGSTQAVRASRSFLGQQEDAPRDTKYIPAAERSPRT